MKLYLKQKVFSFFDNFTAKDESGNDIYFVEGRLAFGKQLEVFNSNGQSVAYITQKLMSFLPRFDIELKGKHTCTVIREFSFLGQNYTIEGIGWDLRGDFLAHEYQLYENEKVIMDMTRALFSWGDSYEISIEKEENALLCLCIALAVDACIAVRKK